MKLGRIYRLTVEIDETTEESVVIEYPITVEFNIIRTSLRSVNTANIIVFNLNEDTRRRIFHDRYDTSIYRRVRLEAGYEESGLETVFLGNIQWAYSYRIGTEWKTEINVFDGGYGKQNGSISKTYPAGYSIRQIYYDLSKAIPRTSTGKIGNFNVDNSRGITVIGNPWNELEKLVSINANLFCDNERINITNDNEYIDDEGEPIYVVKSDTGLLNTPRRGNARIDVDIIFEPRLKVLRIVNLESLEKYYNGQYKIIGFSHKGIISGSVSGTLKTTMNLYKPEILVPL